MPGWLVLRKKRWSHTRPLKPGASPTFPATSPTGYWTARGAPTRRAPSTSSTLSKKTTRSGWSQGCHRWQKNPPPSPLLPSTASASPTAVWAFPIGCWVARSMIAMAPCQRSRGPPVLQSHRCHPTRHCSRWRHFPSRFLQWTWVPGSTRSASEASRHLSLLHFEVSAPCLTSDWLPFTDLQ